MRTCKSFIFIVGIIVSPTLWSQGFVEGNPAGSIWLINESITFKYLNTSNEIGLSRARETETSPSKELTSWSFGDDYVVIERAQLGKDSIGVIRLNYSYLPESKTLILARPEAYSAAWVYKIGATSTGSYVLLFRQ